MDFTSMRPTLVSRQIVRPSCDPTIDPRIYLPALGLAVVYGAFAMWRVGRGPQRLKTRWRKVDRTAQRVIANDCPTTPDTEHRQ
jgi:hypothetical protein